MPSSLWLDKVVCSAFCFVVLPLSLASPHVLQCIFFEHTYSAHVIFPSFLNTTVSHVASYDSYVSGKPGLASPPWQRWRCSWQGCKSLWQALWRLVSSLASMIWRLSTHTPALPWIKSFILEWVDDNTAFNTESGLACYVLETRLRNLKSRSCIRSCTTIVPRKAVAEVSKIGNL